MTPAETWQNATPESQGLCGAELDEALQYAFEDGNDTGAVIIIRNGYVVAEQYSEFKGRTISLPAGPLPRV